MASWGEFIAEIPIINKRSEGIFVKADHVLDLWAERNQLRAELAKLKGNIGTPEPNPAPAAPPLPPMAAPVVDDSRLRETAYLERERCAQEVESLVQSFPAEPEQRELIGQVLRAAAHRLRHKEDEETAEFLASIEIPPAQAPEAIAEATPVAEMEAESAPLAEPIEEVPLAEPVDESVPQP